MQLEKFTDAVVENLLSNEYLNLHYVMAISLCKSSWLKMSDFQTAFIRLKDTIIYEVRCEWKEKKMLCIIFVSILDAKIVGI